MSKTSYRKTTSPSLDNRSKGISTAVALALGPAVALGLARFAYALLLPSMRTDLHWSLTTAGAMNTANAFGYLGGALLGSPVAKRWGTRKSFIFSLGITVASLFATALTGNVSWLMALRVLNGASGAITLITGAGLVAEVKTGKSHYQASKLLGIYFAGGGVGIVLSGLVVPFILANTNPSSNWRWGWVVLGVIGVIAFALSAPTALTSKEPPPAPEADKHWPIRRLMPVIISYALFGTGYIAYMTFIVAFLKNKGAQTGEITLFWVILGTASIVGAFLWSYPIAKLRAGRGTAATLGVLSVGALLPLLFNSPEIVMVSAALFGGSFLSVVTAITAVARRSLKSHHFTPAIAGLTVAFALGQTLGPVLTGIISSGSGGLSIGLGASGGLLIIGAFVSLAQPHYAILEDE